MQISDFSYHTVQVKRSLCAENQLDPSIPLIEHRLVTRRRAIASTHISSVVLVTTYIIIIQNNAHNTTSVVVVCTSGNTFYINAVTLCRALLALRWVIILQVNFWYRTSHPGRLKLLFSPGWYVSISDVLPIESKAMYDS